VECLPADAGRLRAVGRTQAIDGGRLLFGGMQVVPQTLSGGISRDWGACGSPHILGRQAVVGFGLTVSLPSDCHCCFSLRGSQAIADRRGVVAEATFTSDSVPRALAVYDRNFLQGISPLRTCQRNGKPRAADPAASPAARPSWLVGYAKGS
jgi:hypothetical protein